MHVEFNLSRAVAGRRSRLRASLRRIGLESLAMEPQRPADRAMGIWRRAVHALLVDPDFHGRGFGRMLVEEALRRHPGLSTDVNEQNTAAVGFYERLGFTRCGRSPVDRQGRPYPLIQLRYAR